MLVFLRIAVNSQKLSFPSSSQRKEVLLKYTGNTKGATGPERGRGAKHSTGKWSPSLPSSAHASFSCQLLPPGAPESRAPSLTTTRGKRDLFFPKSHSRRIESPWLCVI